MKARFLSCFLFVIAAIFPLALSAQEPVFAKANITLVDGILTIDESDPTAYGLKFKFGSVVGLSAGEKDLQTFDLKTDILFDPTYPSKAPYKRWYDIPYVRYREIRHTHSNVLSGIGDPCRLVGLTPEQIRSGEIDNKKWRLPTGKEYEWLARRHRLITGHHTLLWLDVPAGVVMEGAFFPAAGSRFQSNGRVDGWGWRGNYMSSNGPKDFFSYHLQFTYEYIGSSSTDLGAGSVRCVRQ